MAQSPRDSANASAGIASRARWWCARAAASASRGVAGVQSSPPRTSSTTSCRSPSRGRTASLVTTSAVAVPEASCRRTADLRPPAGGVTSGPPLPRDGDRPLTVVLPRAGALPPPATPREALAAARAHHQRAREAMPPEAFALSRGDCAIETLTT